MVNTATGRDRAQLILLGCVALAFVIISLGLLINTTIYTESSSQALSNAQVDSATSLDLETRRGTRSLIHRANLGDRDRDDGDLHDNVTATVDNYSVLLGEQYARSRAASVDVGYDRDGSELGTRVVQNEDGEFYDEFELDNSVPQRLGWFVINTNVSETQSGDINPFVLTIENGSNDLTVEIYRNDSVSGTEPNLTINTQLDTGVPDRNVTCNPRRNRVVLDVVSGQWIADSCTDPTQLHSISDLEPPHESVDVNRNERFHGTWEFITNRSQADGPVDPDGSSFDDCDVSSSPSGDEACKTPAVWTANVTTGFDSDGATFHRTRNVTIYGADR